MMAKHNLVRSVTCAYSQCGARSRDYVHGRRFYSLPTGGDPSVPQQWLINSGIAHLAEATEKELKRIRICSDHFPSAFILQTGRLLRNAVPIAHDDPRIIHVEGPTPIDEAMWTAQKRSLKNKILSRDNEIAKLKQRNRALQMTLKNTKTLLSRRIKKIENGVISDPCLATAVGRKVQGSLYTFIMMQLFHKDGTVYDQSEKEMAKTMHGTSPTLYAKMRDFFGFVLPSARTLENW